MEIPENKLADFIEDDEKAKWKPVNNHNIKNYTEDEIKRITKNYSDLIGKGGFGEVYKGVLDDDIEVAVKKYISLDFKQGFAKEMTIHCQINHKNVVRLLGYCSEGNASMMVTEYISGGNLRDLLHCSDNPISLDARLGIAIECAEALSCMHSMYQPIIHGDIKPDNILLDSNLGAKLADFGISRLFIKDKTQNVSGSIGYMDPEFLLYGKVDPKNDVYSFGVVLLELVTRMKASENGVSTGLSRNFTHALEKGKKTMVMFDTEIANVSSIKVLEKIGKLAVECLIMNFKERPEMKDVVERLRMLRKLHCQQGQQKTGQWSLWGAQDTQKVNRQGTSLSSSTSTVLYKFNSLGFFSKNAHKNFEKNGGLILTKKRTVKLFTKEELRPILKSRKIIGNSGVSEAYMGILDNELVAVKLASFHILDIEYFADQMIVQYQAIHKNIVRFIGCCLENETPLLVYEFCSRGSLHDILHGRLNLPLNLGVRLSIAAESAGGLAYLHSSGIRHDNFKPAKILLDDSFVPKIDFGVSRLLRRCDEDICQPDMIYYLDPEYIHTGLLTPKSDVYSFGVVLLELISRKTATCRDNNLIRNFLKDHNERKKSTEFFDKDIAVPEDLELLEILAGITVECLNLDTEQRPSMTEVAERLLTLKSRTS